MKETLDEAAESFVNNTRLRNYKVLFIEGAKWMQERMYSEEDMIAFAKYCNLKDDLSVREILTIWFDQFKKK